MQRLVLYWRLLIVYKFLCIHFISRNFSPDLSKILSFFEFHDFRVIGRIWVMCWGCCTWTEPLSLRQAAPLSFSNVSFQSFEALSDSHQFSGRFLRERWMRPFLKDLYHRRLILGADSPISRSAYPNWLVTSNSVKQNLPSSYIVFHFKYLFFSFSKFV